MNDNLKNEINIATRLSVTIIDELSKSTNIASGSAEYIMDMAIALAKTAILKARKMTDTPTPKKSNKVKRHKSQPNNDEKLNTVFNYVNHCVQLAVLSEKMAAKIEERKFDMDNVKGVITEIVKKSYSKVPNIDVDNISIEFDNDKVNITIPENLDEQ